jgi:hypothetical protein
MTGNWQFTATATKGAAPFTALAGFINEEAGDPSIDDFVSAALLTDSNTCFQSPPYISLSGAALNHQLNLGSFLTESQTVTLTGTKNEAANSLTGAYSVVGGCADGTAGTIVGTLYLALDGSYSGAVTGNPAETISLSLTQDTAGDGEGKSFLNGTANLQGLPCGLGSETLDATTSYVIGSAAYITTAIDAAGSQLVASGTFDAAADTITLTSITATTTTNAATSCSESVGPAVLSLSAQSSAAR